jgi:hypothetical protein
MTTDQKRAAFDALPSPEKKRQLEMKIFKGFAGAAGLGVDPGSEKNEEPPLPDMSCTVQGAPRFYELGEITDQDLARNLSRSGSATTGGFFEEEGPLFRMLNKKATSSYTTDGVPVELILHYDKQFPFLPVERLTGSEAKIAAALLPNGPFAKIWIYDSWSNKVLWSS